MSNNKINYNKSNLRIAPSVLPSTNAPLVPISLLSPINGLTNKNNNNNNRNNNNTGSLPSSLIPTQVTPSASSAYNFAPSLSSPSLDDTSNTISFASLNVKGFASNVLKFDAIMDDLFNKDLSVIGLQETHTAERTAELMFKNRCAL